MPTSTSNANEEYRDQHRHWYKNSPKGIFGYRRRKARSRGIEWLLTFDQWWDIWQKSEKWEVRGVGQGRYVMSRHGDKGAYCVGNVFIQLQTDNSSFHPKKKTTLPKGVYSSLNGFRARKTVNGIQHNLGSFKTVEAAQAAYDSFLA